MWADLFRIFYVQLIICGVSFPVMWTISKETRGQVILRKRRPVSEKPLENKARDSRTSAKDFLKENVGRPAYLLVTEPVVFFFTLLTSLSYVLVFLSTQSATLVYQSLYDWPESSIGIAQSALLVGQGIGFVTCLWQNKLFKRAYENAQHVPNSRLPEVRLYLAVPGSFIGLGGGLFWYGWTSSSDIHWMLPTIGLTFIGYGSMAVMCAVMMYLTDAYAKYAASASAAACFGENIFAAFVPLATNAMYGRLGYHWASSLLGFVALVLTLAPIALIRWGEDIRKRSPFMAVSAYT